MTFAHVDRLAEGKRIKIQNTVMVVPFARVRHPERKVSR